MLDPKSLQKLYQILNSEDSSLQDIESEFLSEFNDSLSVFKSSYALSNLINLNLLTNRQRIIALFLLIENFKYQGIKKHPFGATILNVSTITTQSFERKMIAEMIVDMKRQKYARSKIDTLYEQEQSMLDPIDERPQLKKIREQFISNLPKISQFKKSAVKNIIPDFNEKDKKLYPPQTEPNLNTIKESDIGNQSFNVGFMRPVPKFIDINPSELNWLSPGIITDVHWDNSAEIDKKLTKAKSLVKKASQGLISKEESGQVERSLEFEPYAVLNLGVTPQILMQIIKNANNNTAAFFLTKLSNYPIIGDYLYLFIETPVSINIIDVLSRVHKAVKIPNDFTITFVLWMMQDISQKQDQDIVKPKLAKLAASFIKSFIRNNILDFKNHQEEFQIFINSCIQVEEVAQLKKLLPFNKE